MRARVIDANVILRFLTADNSEQSSRCRDLFARVQAGQETVYLPEVALSDVVWTLKSFYRWPASRIRRFISDLLALKGIQMARKLVVQQALVLFADQNIDFSDALIAAEMLQTGRAEMYSFDRDFERVPDLTRLEP